jgi:hypothetical protein
MTRRAWWLLLVAWACACACVTERPPSPKGAGPEAWVNPLASASRELGTRQDPYRTLDKALRQCPSRATLFLAPGTCAVNLTVTKALTLVGDANAPAVLRAADPAKPVIDLRPGATAVLVNIQLSGGQDGVRAAPSARFSMKKCQVTDNAACGVMLEGNKDAWGRHAASAILEDCLLTGNGVGACVDNATAWLSKCQVASNHRQGVIANGDARLSLVACRVNGNGDDGARLDLGPKARVVVDQNDVNANGADGIDVLPVADAWWRWNAVLATVRQNTVNDNKGYGLVARDRADGRPLADPTDAVILGNNQFAGNGQGATAGVGAD